MNMNRPDMTEDVKPGAGAESASFLPQTFPMSSDFRVPLLFAGLRRWFVLPLFCL